MKRAKIGILAGVVIVVLALLPYGAGFVVQTKFETTLAQWAEQDPLFETTILSYKRGFWSSTAEVMLVVNNPEGDEALVTHKEWAHILLKEHIYHGPLALGSKNLTPVWAVIDTQLMKAVDHGYPDKAGQFDGYMTLDATARSLLHFNGALETHLQSGFFSSEMPSVPSIQLRNIEIESFNTKDFVKRAITTKLAELQFKKDQYDIAATGLTFKGHWRQTPYEFYEGYSNINVATFSSHERGKQALDLKNIDVRIEQTLQQQLYHSAFSLAFDEGVFKGKTFGPLQHKFEINNISAPLLQKLQQQLKLISHSPLPFEQKRVQLMALLPLMPKLLAEGASFEIKQFDLTLPEGRCSLQGHARLAHEDQETPPAAMMQLLPRVTAAATIQLPVALVSQMAIKVFKKRLSLAQQAKADETKVNEIANAPTDLSEQEIRERVKARLHDWEQRGLLVRKDNHYEVSLSLKHGRFLVNSRSLEASKPMPESLQKSN